MLCRLEKIMSDRKLTKYRLSKMCDINISTVQTFWKNKMKALNMTTLIKLCDGLGVSIEFMLYGSLTLSKKEIEVALKYRTTGDSQKITIDIILGIL